MKHTRGPWKAVRQSEDFDGSSYLEPMDEVERKEFLAEPFVRIVNSQNETITTNHDLFVFKNSADALLLATAPELLEALESVFCQCSPLYPCDENCFMHKVESVIRKAKGLPND